MIVFAFPVAARCSEAMTRMFRQRLQLIQVLRCEMHAAVDQGEAEVAYYRLSLVRCEVRCLREWLERSGVSQPPLVMNSLRLDSSWVVLAYGPVMPPPCWCSVPPMVPVAVVAPVRPLSPLAIDLSSRSELASSSDEDDGEDRVVPQLD